jgi:hypothetical protein
MKSKIFLAVLFTLVMAYFSCDTGTSPGSGSAPVTPQTGTYTSKDASGNTYTLTITEKRAVAVYGGKTGDSYVLQITSPAGAVIGTSRGTIQSVSVSGFTLKPSNSTTTFSVAVSGDTMTGFSGTAITFDDGKTAPAPGSLTPVTNGGGEPAPAPTPTEDPILSDGRFEGAWRTTDLSGEKERYDVFSGNTMLIVLDDGYYAKGTFTYTQNTITLTGTEWGSSSNTMWGPWPAGLPSTIKESYTISGNKFSYSNTIEVEQNWTPHEKIEPTPFAGTWEVSGGGQFLKFFGNTFMEITDDEDDYAPGSTGSDESKMLNLDANDSAYRGTFEYNETGNTITLTYTDEFSSVVSPPGWVPPSGPLTANVTHSYTISGTPTTLSIADSEKPVSSTLVLNGVQYTKIKNW